MNDELQIPAPFLPLLTEKHRYKVAYGGRGSGKSWAYGQALLVKSTERKTRILCARQYQSSIKTSVHQLLADSISRLGWDKLFTIYADRIVCKRTSSDFLFKGVKNNPAEFKSTEGVDYCWVEEAQAVSGESWDIIIPTIRKDDSEIWLTFNPDLETDATYQRFVLSERPDTWKCLVNYDENPFFPQVLRAEMEYCRSVSYEDYANIWLGKPRTNTDAQVFKGRYEIEDFDTPENARFFHGADWGFAQDPTTLVRCFIKDDYLYVDGEAYGVGVELDETPQLFWSIPTSKDYPIKADCARPETISFMKRRGFNITPAKKWQGSVEDGLAVLKSFKKIIIHPRCKHTADEFRLYSYKVDKINGDILPVVEDKNNHCIDSLRYALDGYIKGRGMMNIASGWEKHFTRY